METLIALGSEIKTLEDTGDRLKIGGYLVLFGSPELFVEFMQQAINESPDWSQVKENQWYDRANQLMADHYGIIRRVGRRKMP